MDTYFSFYVFKSRVNYYGFYALSMERMAVKLLLFLPPIAILIFIVLMSTEADYVFISRMVSFFNP
jgi:cytochrome c oxidase subunit IV